MYSQFGVGPLLYLCCSSHVPLLYIFCPPVVPLICSCSTSLIPLVPLHNTVVTDKSIFAVWLILHALVNILTLWVISCIYSN